MSHDLVMTVMESWQLKLSIGHPASHCILAVEAVEAVEAFEIMIMIMMMI